MIYEDEDEEYVMGTRLMRRKMLTRKRRTIGRDSSEEVRGAVASEGRRGVRQVREDAAGLLEESRLEEGGDHSRVLS